MAAGLLESALTVYELSVGATFRHILNPLSGQLPFRGHALKLPRHDVHQRWRAGERFSLCLLIRVNIYVRAKSTCRNYLMRARIDRIR
jgi:hypothetical protein